MGNSGPGVDVSIMVGCPMDGLAVMRRVSRSEIADSAVGRASTGILAGFFGFNLTGRQFSSDTYEHSDAWVYQSDIFPGMSGSCVLNGKMG